jgi:site-specific DNA recombinase
MRAALYIRVSDEEQVREGYSIDAQKTLLLKKSQQLEYDVFDMYVDDGYSAKDMKRPALQKLLKDVEMNLFEVVLFWRLDRFTRKSKDFQKMMELLGAHNAGIKSATENIDTTTAFGRFSLELTVSLAQLERETTAERVHFVMEDRHRKGLRNGAVAPYGYDLVDGKLIINPIEAEVVKRIFSMYQKNSSFTHIAKRFNIEGISKGMKGAKWAAHSVYYILSNPIYCGKMRWNYRKLAGKKTGAEIIVDGSHEPIISEEDFEFVQSMREMRKRLGKKSTSDYSFTGVLRCGRCGYSMYGSSQARTKGSPLGDKLRYYKCQGRFNMGICDMPIINEASVSEAFVGLISDLDKIESEIKANQEVAAANESVQLAEHLKSRINEIQKRKKKWQLAYANDVLTLEELREHTEEDKKEEEYLRSQLGQMTETQKSPWSRDEIIQRIMALRDTWYQIDDEVAKKNFLNFAFEHITINTEVTKAKGGPGRRVPITITSWDFKS